MNNIKRRKVDMFNTTIKYDSLRIKNDNKQNISYLEYLGCCECFKRYTNIIFNSEYNDEYNNEIIISMEEGKLSSSSSSDLSSTGSDNSISSPPAKIDIREDNTYGSIDKEWDYLSDLDE
jgi:hypothetical protein